MATQPVGLHDESVKLIDKHARDGESKGDTAARLITTADSRLTALSKYAKAQKAGAKPKKAKKAAKA
jgi:hypothetical protein